MLFRDSTRIYINITLFLRRRNLIFSRKNSANSQLFFFFHSVPFAVTLEHRYSGGGGGGKYPRENPECEYENFQRRRETKGALFAQFSSKGWRSIITLRSKRNREKEKERESRMHVTFSFRCQKHARFSRWNTVNINFHCPLIGYVPFA